MNRLTRGRALVGSLEVGEMSKFLQYGYIPSINLSLGSFILSLDNMRNQFLEVSVGSSTNNIIASNVHGKSFIVINSDLVNSATIMVSGGVGVTIAAGKSAQVYCNGIDYIRISADV